MHHCSIGERDEVEELRASVKRLREQRNAVENLKEFALSKERQVGELEGRIKDLSLQISHLSKRESQSKALEEQLFATEKDLDYQKSIIIQLEKNVKDSEDARRLTEERFQNEMRRNETLCKNHQQEVAELRKVLMETKEAYQVRRDTSSALVEQLRGEKNELLVMRGELEEGIRKLSVEKELCQVHIHDNEQKFDDLRREKQELKSTIHDLEVQLETSRLELRERDDQDVEQLSSENLHLTTQLEEAHASVAMMREMCSSKEEIVCGLRSDVLRLEEELKELSHLRPTIVNLRRELEREREERSSLSRARSHLLSQLCEEECKLNQLLQTSTS